MSDSISLAFISSAFNEAENLEELYLRCRLVFDKLQLEYVDHAPLEFRFMIADNGSDDDSLAVLEDLSRRDQAVVAFANRINYGVEASLGNLIEQAGSFDLIVLLCSDLQDPPEVATKMIRTLLNFPELDAVLGVKTRSAGGGLLRLARRIYYQALGLSSRRPIVPNGFHGFGCYRQEVVVEASRFWDSTDLNVRQCLTNACQSPMQIEYRQDDRKRGKTSYQGWGYWPEALRAIMSGDAAASRLALMFGSAGLVLSSMVGLFLLLNFLGGSSGYGGGIPTVMGLVLISFAMQMLLVAMLSRQIEGLRMGGFRRKVWFRRLGDGI